MRRSCDMVYDTLDPPSLKFEKQRKTMLTKLGISYAAQA